MAKDERMNLNKNIEELEDMLFDADMTEWYEAVKQLKQENEKLRKCVKFYAYPKHEDGDRAYIFGHEARETLKDLEHNQ